MRFISIGLKKLVAGVGDNFKAILEKRINQTDLPPADKQSMIDALRELPSEPINT